MSSFDVNTAKLDRSVGEINDVSRRLKNLRDRMNQCNSKLGNCLTSSASGAVKSNVNAISQSVIYQINALNKMASALSSISKSYSSTESSITSNKVAIEKPKSAWETVNGLLHGDSISGALISGETTATGKIAGIGAAATFGGSVLGSEIKGKSGAGIKYDENGKLKDLGAKAELEASGYLAKGYEKWNVGVVNADLSATVGSVSATGAIGASLFKDGKLSPNLNAEIGAEATALSGKAKIAAGDENFDVHGQASGKVATAEANASAKAGVFTYKDEHGNVKTDVGFQAEAKAEAYLATGKISGGFNIFGIQVDIGAEGKAGGAGANAGFRAGAGGVKGSVGVGLGVGAGLDVSIDWTNFKLPEINFPEIKMPDFSNLKWW